jgi:crossover junction endodeoxyribonuclease RuvC
MIILGIDPGTAIVGYGVIEIKAKGKTPGCLAYGSIQTNPKELMPNRLKTIYQELEKIIKKYRPDIMAVENIYFFKNLKTAMPVSQAKGVILLAAAQKNIPVKEVTPMQVKMTVVGYGKAEKQQVQKMVKLLLNLKEIPKPDDVADALAVALCCPSLDKRF